MIKPLVPFNAKKLNMSDLQIHVNGQQTFFLSQRILSKYSKKIRKFMKREKQTIEIDEFPGGSEAFELVSRFCYNNGVTEISVANVCVLHCCAVFLGMSENSSCRNNLLRQTRVFLEGIFYWSWNDILTCLKSCETFFVQAETNGLIEKLICSLLAKIAQNSDLNLRSLSSSSSSSSPETGSHSSSSRKQLWWFQDLTILSPKIIESFIKALGAYGSENNNLVLTKFLLHYLKTRNHVRTVPPEEYSALADTAVHGVVFVGKNAFSCRGVFWVLRIVSGFGISPECRMSLERLIGGMLDQATLDDLLVSGTGNGGVYDVNLVLRLIKLFVRYNDEVTLPKLHRVGELIDMYLGEIGPDPNINVSKFLAVAESLPDCARDTFDHVYRAIDIYLQSHLALSSEERSRLCRCLNFKKLSLETCKDLAKNPRIPPRISVQALRSQHSTINVNDDEYEVTPSRRSKANSKKNDYQLVLYENYDESKSGEVGKEEIKVNLARMQGRVVELEKVCREMRVQMARMVKLSPENSRNLPRMC